MNKKGFTLIELLAVIVILAIIALIATPMILGVIDKAKKGSVESSALGYIDAAEKVSVTSILDGKTLAAGVYTVSGKTITMDATNTATVDLKGTAPTSGWVYVDATGTVVAAQLKFDSYSKTVRYNGTTASADLATVDSGVTTANAASFVSSAH